MILDIYSTNTPPFFLIFYFFVESTKEKQKQVVPGTGANEGLYPAIAEHVVEDRSIDYISVQGVLTRC